MKIEAGRVRHDTKRGTLWLNDAYSPKVLELVWQVMDRSGIEPRSVLSIILDGERASVETFDPVAKERVVREVEL